jgi:hypothetical protein
VWRILRLVEVNRNRGGGGLHRLILEYVGGGGVMYRS